MAELTHVRPLEIQCSQKQKTSTCRTLRSGRLNDTSSNTDLNDNRRQYQRNPFKSRNSMYIALHFWNSRGGWVYFAVCDPVISIDCSFDPHPGGLRS